MRIGIDLDNTLICYDGVFHSAARERGLIAAELPTGKNAVRDFLNGCGRDHDFTELQGYVYGTRMALAGLYPGAREFLARARAAGHRLFIVSHKTRYPLRGPRHDLHASALAFLRECEIVGRHAVPLEDVFLEPSREQKIARIGELECDVFVDDLPDVLTAPGFPARVRAILFDPAQDHENSGLETYGDWNAIIGALLGGAA